MSGTARNDARNSVHVQGATEQGAPPARRLDARGEFATKAIGEEARSAYSKEWIVLCEMG